MPFGYELLVICFMLVFNAVFAAYEIALASLSQSRIAVLLSEKRKGSGDAAFMKGRMEASLAIVQLGITLVGAIAAATGGAGVEEIVVPYLQTHWGVSEFLAKMCALAFLVIPLTFITIVFGELIPKIFALRNKEAVVLALSPIMKFLGSMGRPVIRVIEISVKKALSLFSFKRHSVKADEKAQSLYELKAAVSLARASMLMGAREERIVLSAAQLSSRMVREIMIPAEEIFMLPAGSALMDAFLKAHLDMHTRFPVCAVENDPQTIQGYVNFKDIISALKVKRAQHPAVRDITRPMVRVDEKTSLSGVLEKMIQEKTHIMLVGSPGGPILGMVTLEDVIEELVGEIEDEFGRSSTNIQPYGSVWIMGGGVLMTKVAVTLGLDWTGRFPDKNIPTLEAWCSAKSGKPVSGGEVVESDGIRVIPRKFRKKKLSEAIVSIAEAKHRKGAE